MQNEITKLKTIERKISGNSFYMVDWEGIKYDIDRIIISRAILFELIDLSIPYIDSLVITECSLDKYRVELHKKLPSIIKATLQSFPNYHLGAKSGDEIKLALKNCLLFLRHKELSTPNSINSEFMSMVSTLSQLRHDDKGCYLNTIRCQTYKYPRYKSRWVIKDLKRLKKGNN